MYYTQSCTLLLFQPLVESFVVFPRVAFVIIIMTQMERFFSFYLTVLNALPVESFCKHPTSHTLSPFTTPLQKDFPYEQFIPFGSDMAIKLIN